MFTSTGFVTLCYVYVCNVFVFKFSLFLRMLYVYTMKYHIWAYFPLQLPPYPPQLLPYQLHILFENNLPSAVSAAHLYACGECTRALEICL